MNLTIPNTISNTWGVTAKSVARISLLNETSAQALNRSVFFTPIVYGGLCGSASARRLSFRGKANSAQSATLLISLIGGSSQTRNESTTMSNNSNIEFQLETLLHEIKTLSLALCCLTTENAPLSVISSLASIQHDKLIVLDSVLECLGVDA